MHHSILRLLSCITALLCGAVLLLPQPAHATEPPAFEARFENDGDGTWLVYPTIPGWHYKIEASPTLDDASFTYLQGSFRYGNGQDQRRWVAPPPPQPTTTYTTPPPPRSYFGLFVTIYVATDAGVPQLEVIRAHETPSVDPAPAPHAAPAPQPHGQSK